MIVRRILPQCSGTPKRKVCTVFRAAAKANWRISRPSRSQGAPSAARNAAACRSNCAMAAMSLCASSASSWSGTALRASAVSGACLSQRRLARLQNARVLANHLLAAVAGGLDKGFVHILDLDLGLDAGDDDAFLVGIDAVLLHQLLSRRDGAGHQPPWWHRRQIYRRRGTDRQS